MSSGDRSWNGLSIKPIAPRQFQAVEPESRLVRSIKQMPGAVKSSRHRTSVVRFLSDSDWNETGLLEVPSSVC